MSENAEVLQHDQKTAVEENDENNAVEEKGASLQFLSFTVGEEEYGIDIMQVREIRGWTETTRLPNSPNFACGVINLRGIVIPIFDLRKRFGMGATEVTEKNVVIVIALKDRTIGILVDTVSDIINVSANDIRPAPEVETKVDKIFVEGLIAVEDRMVVLLEVNQIFNVSKQENAENDNEN